MTALRKFSPCIATNKHFFFVVINIFSIHALLWHFSTNRSIISHVIREVPFSARNKLLLPENFYLLPYSAALGGCIRWRHLLCVLSDAWLSSVPCTSCPIRYSLGSVEVWLMSRRDVCIVCK